MQIKITLIFHFTPVRIAIKKMEKAKWMLGHCTNGGALV
jgi:hypothetical protein